MSTTLLTHVYPASITVEMDYTTQTAASGPVNHAPGNVVAAVDGKARFHTQYLPKLLNVLGVAYKLPESDVDVDALIKRFNTDRTVANAVASAVKTATAKAIGDKMTPDAAQAYINKASLEAEVVAVKALLVNVELLSEEGILELIESVSVKGVSHSGADVSGLSGAFGAEYTVMIATAGKVVMRNMTPVTVPRDAIMYMLPVNIISLVPGMTGTSTNLQPFVRVPGLDALRQILGLKGRTPKLDSFADMHLRVGRVLEDGPSFDSFPVMVNIA